MVTKVFYISGNKDQIFNVGFRPALIGTGGEHGVKIHASNLKNESKVRVILNGDSTDVAAFHEHVKATDIRVRGKSQSGGSEQSKPNYTVGEISEYDGPEIDRNGYQLGFLSGQMYKGFAGAEQALNMIGSEFKALDDKYGKLGEKAGHIDDKLGNIDKKLGSLDEYSKSISKNIETMTTSVKDLTDALKPSS